MKSYIRITVLTAVVFLAGIILFAVLTSDTVTQDTSRRAITALNDMPVPPKQTVQSCIRLKRADTAVILSFWI